MQTGDDSPAPKASRSFEMFLKTASYSICLVLLLVTPIVSGQAGQHKPLPTEPLEGYDNPPAPSPLWGIGVSPGMVTQEGPFTSHQVNVNGSGQNITGDAGNEPSITVDPTNHSKMVIGWRQFNSVSSNFRQAGSSNLYICLTSFQKHIPSEMPGSRVRWLPQR